MHLPGTIPPDVPVRSQHTVRTTFIYLFNISPGIPQQGLPATILSQRLCRLTENEGAHRADRDTLTAVITPGPSERLISERCDHPAKPAVSKTNDPYPQSFTAQPNTSATQHTLVGIIDKQLTGLVHRQSGQDLREPLSVEPQPEVSGNVLELARTVGCAVTTIHRMTGQEQFQTGPGQSQCPLPPGVDYHSLGHGSSTCRHGTFLTFDLHKAQTTGSIGFRSLPDGTQVGYVDSVIESCPQDTLSRGSSHSFPVNLQLNPMNSFQDITSVLCPEERGHFETSGTSPVCRQTPRRAPPPYRSWYRHQPF